MTIKAIDRETIKADVLVLAAKYAPVIKEARKEGADISINDTIFNECMPDGLTPELVSSYQDYMAVTTAAMGLAFGEDFIESNKEDKEYTTASMKMGFGADAIETFISTNDAEGSASPITMRTVVRVKARDNVGSYGKVVRYLKASASTVLSD